MMLFFDGAINNMREETFSQLLLNVIKVVFLNVWKLYISEGGKADMI